MSILKTFRSTFGNTASILDEQVAFVQRINQLVFEWVESEDYPLMDAGMRSYRTRGPDYGEVFDQTCIALGINANDEKRKLNRFRSFHQESTPSLRAITRDDFNKTLEVVCVVFEQFQEYPELQKLLSQKIEETLSMSTIDVGVRWKDGMFYKSGFKFLDENLIEESLDFLSIYPAERKDFYEAVRNYSEKRFDDVISDCYNVIEGLARKLLNNSAVLENNIKEFVSLLKLTAHWEKMLGHFMHFANEYKRHAGENRHKIDPKEVEAYLYFTGLLVRLALSK